MNDMCKNNLSLSTNHSETTKRNIKSCKYYPFVSEQKILKKIKGKGVGKEKIEMIMDLKGKVEKIRVRFESRNKGE